MTEALVIPRRQRLPSSLRFLRIRTGLVGVLLLAFVLAVALLGPAFAPHSPTVPVGTGEPFSPPSAVAPLGTDQVGRDVLSRILYGGRSVLLLSILAAMLAYAIGGTIGLYAGYTRSWVGGLLMRAVDVVLAFPPLIFLLVLVTGAGSGRLVLVVGTGFVQMPYVARVVRGTAVEQSVRGFVEAAIARGDSTGSILRREILPNIVPGVVADLGLRVTFSVILIASVNFLGLGLQPPTADWGLMVSENREAITINPWAVLVPAALIAMLTIGLNLTGDAIARSLGRSDVSLY